MSSPRLGALVILLVLVWSADAHAAKLVRDGSELKFTGDPTLTTDPFITKNDSSGEYEISNSSQAIAPIPDECEYVLSTSQRWVSCEAGARRGTTS